jgi:adenylyltransferase/sulfurtransferase
MNDQQLLRYSRHILLPEIGIEGQQKLSTSHALIIGVGGLGAPAAIYLAATGVGTLTLCDGDRVDLSNLQRQIVHRTDAVSRAKTDSARDTLAALNPEIRINSLTTRAVPELLSGWVAAADVVLDCSDNFATRFAINRACVIHHKPLVSGAAIRFEGQIAVFDQRRPWASCYGCLFPEQAQEEDVRCATAGIFAPLTGIIGTLQAAEALKLLMNIDSGLRGKLLRLEAITMRWHTSDIPRDPECAVCGAPDLV